MVGAYGSTNFTKLGWKDIYSGSNCNCNNNNGFGAAVVGLASVGSIFGILALSGAFKSGKGGNGTSTSTQTTVDPNAALNEQIKAQEKVVEEKQNNVDTKLDNIETAKTKISEAEAQWDENNKVISSKIETETGNVKKFEEAKTKQTALDKDIKDLEASIKSAIKVPASATPEEKAQIEATNRQIDERNKLLEQQKTAKENEKAQYDKVVNDTTYSQAQSRLDAAKKAREELLAKDADIKKANEELAKANQELSAAKTDLANEQTKLENLKKQKDMAANADALDGSGVSRLFSKKTSQGNQIHNYMALKDKFEADPTSLTKEELETLQNAGEFGNNLAQNNIGTAKQFGEQLVAWHSNNSAKIDEALKFYNRVKTDK